MRGRRLAGCFLLTCFFASSVSASVSGEGGADGATGKSGIRFDLDRVNADGLQGPPDGLRALHYEYCIPDRTEAIREVTAIDPTLRIQRGSPGRVGCVADELLCLGLATARCCRGSQRSPS